MNPIKSVHKKLLAAAALAVVVAVGTWWTMESARRDIARTTRLTTVLKTKKFLQNGKSIVPELVEEVFVPEAYVSATAVRKKSDLLDPQGRPRFKARIGLSKGEFLATALLAEPSTFGGLAWTLDPGQSAFSLKLNPEDAVAGLVQPGDIVDVFSFAGSSSKVVLSRVRVVAMGDRLWDPSGAPASAEISKPMALEPVLVTLMGTPTEALQVHQAMMKGTLHLALVSPLTEPVSPGE